MQGIIQRFDHCPHRESSLIGRVRRGEYKCYGCRKKRGLKLGSIVEGLRVPLFRVLIAIKLFVLDTSVQEATHQLGLSYNMVYDLFDLFRQSIVRTDSDTSLTLSGEIERDES